MKKFSIPCDFNGVQAPFTIYIGDPEPKHHPLHFQADWLSRERGGTIPSNVMDSVAKLKDLSEKNNVSFEELCVYALGAAQQQESEEAEDDDNEDTDGNEEVSDETSEETTDENNEIKDDTESDKPTSGG
jgi:hypothetical protein